MEKALTFREKRFKKNNFHLDKKTKCIDGIDTEKIALSTKESYGDR